VINRVLATIAIGGLLATGFASSKSSQPKEEDVRVVLPSPVPYKRESTCDSAEAYRRLDRAVQDRDHVATKEESSYIWSHCTIPQMK
jgi:hypothetical protein